MMAALIIAVACYTNLYAFKTNWGLSAGRSLCAEHGRKHQDVFRVTLILLSSVSVCDCVTAFAGPISFVGIAVPHLVKQAD